MSIGVVHAPSVVSGIGGVTVLSAIEGTITGALILKLIIVTISAIPTVLNFIERKKNNKQNDLQK